MIALVRVRRGGHKKSARVCDAGNFHVHSKRNYWKRKSRAELLLCRRTHLQSCGLGIATPKWKILLEKYGVSLRTLTFKLVLRVNDSELEEIAAKYMDLVFCYAASTINTSAKK